MRFNGDEDEFHGDGIAASGDGVKADGDGEIFVRMGLTSTSVSLFKLQTIAAYNWRTQSPSQVLWSGGRRPLDAALHSPDEPSELSQ